jgi:hypothetical protein
MNINRFMHFKKKNKGDPTTGRVEVNQSGEIIIFYYLY